MSNLDSKVPESAIRALFGGIMAISPEGYSELLHRLAEDCDVPCDDAFREYVRETLVAQPPINPENF